MSKIVPSGPGRLALRFCAAGAVAALVAGCSTDSTRLSDPFSNPFATASNDPATQPVHHNRAIPAGRSPPVVSQALPARSTTAVASNEPLRPRLTTAYNGPISHETTGSIDPGPARSAPGASYGGWTSSGGVAITVGQGETADILSKRYGVPTGAMLQTNGLRNAADVRPGNRLTIPVYNAVAAAQQHAAPQVAAAEPPRAVEAPVQPKPSRSAARAALLKPKQERMAAAAARAPTKPVAQIKPVAPAKPVESAKLADRKAKSVKLEAAKAHAPKVVAEAAPAPMHPVVDKTATAKPAKVAPKVAALTPAAPPPPKAAPAPQTDPAPTASVAPPAAVADASGNPEFRWPARGRIIQGFKGGNDGINIAVPEGTAVKAAEGGTVAYAGSELKGYGNLVLIRHPNGYVTAYANNGELDVKRGEQVKRGQVIAKSGQSGNVTSPQLHFELRKGSTPVDPTSYLAGL